MLPYFLMKSKKIAENDVKDRKTKEQISQFYEKIEKMKKTLDLINFVTFLYTKKFPTLEMRAAQIQHVPIDENRLRWLDYEYLNREIIWKELSTFIFAALPFVQNLAMTSLFKKVFLFTTLLGPFAVDLNKETNTNKCVICSADPPTMPQ